MTTRTDDSESAPIESRDDLLATFAAGEKPRDSWLIGTEHEKFVYRVSDHCAPSYDEPGGIRDLLLGLAEFEWQPVVENGNVIALTGPDGTISLEPAGQFELSGAALENLHQTCAEADRHLKQCKAVGERLGVGFLGLGMWPDKARSELPVMPKGRYGIMLDYMPKVGSLGLDMMLRTCTIQTNLDYSSEADMVKKFRVGLALQPVATALFANSPFTEGKPNGYLSYRSHIWEDTDPDRTGMLPFVFEEGFGYERYLDYALDVPMYFVFRDGRYVDVAGESFRDFLDGKPTAAGREAQARRLHRPSFDDLPRGSAQELPGDARRRRRSVEPDLRASGPVGRAALRRPGARCGLGPGQGLDDRGARSAPPRCPQDWRSGRRSPARRDRPRDLARSVLDIAARGLSRRGRLNSAGDSEAGFLDPLNEIVASGKTPAERLLDLYHGRWQGDLTRIYSEMSY
jgi:glutamate--cysteine ligase